MNHPIISALIVLFHLVVLDPQRAQERAEAVQEESLVNRVPQSLLVAVCFGESTFGESRRQARFCGCMAGWARTDKQQAACAARSLARGIDQCGSIPRALNRYVSGTCSGANSPRHTRWYREMVLRVFRRLDEERRGR